MKYIIACITGAFIGYITNWLAIKMLFRPYTEKRVLGVKMPFTPGLIPKEQKRIAKSVGETVGKHLLSKETLVHELCSDKIYNHIEKLIKDKVINLGKSNLRLGDKLLPLKNIINNKVMTFQKSEKIKDLISDFLRGKEDDLKNSQSTVNELLGNQSIDIVKMYVDKNKETISLDIVKTIKEPLMEDKIKSAISSGVSSNVNPLMAMFINADTIYEKVISYIENNIYKPDVQNEIILIIYKIIDKIGNQNIKDIIEEIDCEDKEKLLEMLSNKISIHILNESLINFAIDNIFDINISDLINGNENKIISVVNNIVKGAYSNFISKQGEEIVDLLDIERIIENQINSFPVEFAEKLIVDIANKELKAITWLGALLGCIMGVLSPILSSLY